MQGGWLIACLFALFAVVFDERCFGGYNDRRKTQERKNPETTHAGAEAGDTKKKL